MEQTTPEFNVGDLVYYNPTYDNFYANGSRQLGVILEITRDSTPLISNFPEKKYFEHEYLIKWISSGLTSKLLGFNLKKVKIPQKTT